MLGTSDAAAALEAATLKISTLSEELHAARSVCVCVCVCSVCECYRLRRCNDSVSVEWYADMARCSLP